MIRFEYKECIICEGEFQRKEVIHLDIYNNPYCECCFREKGIKND